MMRYRIAETIIFDPEERTLTMEGHNESVALSIPASRLLAFMLKHKDILHERDELLIEVWDKYGLKSSGSNLNQYISVLRRTLSSMNCDAFFITVPKVGFKVNPAIDISVIKDCPVAETTSDLSDDVATTQHARTGRSDFTDKMALYILTFLLLALTLFIYFKKNDWKTKQIDPLYSRFGNSCQIVYLNNTSDAAKEQLNIKAMAYLKEIGRECTDTDLFIVSVASTEHSGGIVRSFLSLCHQDSRGVIVDCTSHYSRR